MNIKQQQNLNHIRYLRYYRKKVGKYIDADWYYGFQCVDLVRDYCWDVHNYNMGRLPSAKDANLQTTFPWRMEVKVWVEDFRRWDIIVTWPTKNNKHWHIAIVHKQLKDRVEILEQNGSGRNSGKVSPWNEIRVRKIPYWNILKVFRSYIKK